MVCISTIVYGFIEPSGDYRTPRPAEPHKAAMHTTDINYHFVHLHTVYMRVHVHMCMYMLRRNGMGNP